MTVGDIIRWTHIVAGVTALGAFWIPLVVRKGSLIHRRAGWAFAWAMWSAALAALAICAQRLLDDNKENDGAALFLAFVGLLAANGAATGVRVLRRKTRTGERPHIVDVGSSSLLFAASVALGGFGIAKSSALNIAFAVLGIFLSIRQLRYWLTTPPTRMDWWYAHMGNMLAACIGTVTAFLVVNVPRFGLQRYALFLWLGPGILGGIAIAAWTRHYRRRFERRSASPTSATRTAT